MYEVVYDGVPLAKEQELAELGRATAPQQTEAIVLFGFVCVACPDSGQLYPGQGDARQCSGRARPSCFLSK